MLAMQALKKLSLACNRLASLPDALAEVSTLAFLDVSFNELRTLPSALTALTRLAALNVSFNALGGAAGGEFPDVVFGLPSLRELNLDYTGCWAVDARFGRLTNIEALQARSCACGLCARGICRGVWCPDSC